MKKIIILITTLVVSLGLNAQTLAPIPVNNPDVPDNGWYWAGNDGGATGWGVNIDIQQGTITESGLFLFGAFYTYDENRNPIWYTFSGEYVPNSDVYAWREDRGNMGTFSGVILESEGGTCLICVPQSATGAVNAGIGDVTITWVNPYQASVSIGANTVHEVSRFQFNSGALSYNIDFLTEGWWEVFYQAKYINEIVTSNNLVLKKYWAGQGLVKFEEWPSSEFVGSPFYNENLKYYVTTDGSSLPMERQLYGSSSVNNGNWLLKLVVIYNPETHLSSLHLNNHIGSNLGILCAVTVDGYFNPSKVNSVFYGKVDDRCTNSEFVDPGVDIRGSMAYINYVGHAGDALTNNAIFRDSQGQ